MPTWETVQEAISTWARRMEDAAARIERLDEDIREAQAALDACKERKAELYDEMKRLEELRENSDEDFMAWAWAANAWAEQVSLCTDLQNRLKAAENRRARELPGLAEELGRASHWFGRWVSMVPYFSNP